MWQENILNQKLAVMNNENEKYTAFIHQIKNTKVQISDTQKLTSQIMQRIEHLPQKKGNNKTFLFVSWTSSIAASLLIGLFIFEQFLQPNTMDYNQLDTVYTCTSIDYEKNYCMEKSTNIYTFMQLRKEHQKKNQIVNSIINKYKTL